MKAIIWAPFVTPFPLPPQAMDGETHSTDEDFGSGSGTDDPGFTSSGVFSRSHHFTGGTFTHITHNYPTAPTLPSDNYLRRGLAKTLNVV
ncbi:hypothetical protein DFH08DRAFT_1087061 [Mycena albidolilacea]|uniref:Uncharacterized protein n=1 Tax=Mycena albidolilacea TaxID=1033008 RepID=A0AAD6ZBT1_9AGAR|nr:hypothetical protein DFH08DRAFT_1087061 [Mycena albidolilacea]